MRWRAASGDEGGEEDPIGLRELLEGPPGGDPRASGTLMRYAAALEGRDVREVVALDEAQLGELGMKPFHARRLRRWIEQLEEAPEQEQDAAQSPGDRPPPFEAEAIDTMDVGELKRAL
jgi:hypothetical protein|eukprot:COSAG02_NODE_24768_length_678_cov_0.958549_1_plen_119_part_00